MLAQLRRALLREPEHVDLGAELQASRRTGLDARRLEPLTDAIRAEGALVDLLRRRIELRNIEWTSGDAVLAPDAVLLIEVDDAVAVLDDCAIGRARAKTSGVLAVHALILAHRPHQRPVVARVLVELDQVPEVPRRRRHRLIRVVERRVCEWHVVPFDTRDLAGFAADARGHIDVLAHRLFAVCPGAGHRT